MFHKLLVPLDGSGEAETAIAYATEIAAAASADIIIAGVADTSQAFPLYQQYLDRTLSLLEADLKRIGYTGRGATARMVTGKAAQEILAIARVEAVGLVTLARRGRSGHGPWPLGSVASRVLQKTTIPILIAKAGKPASPQDKRIKRILVPLDTSDAGATAVPYAVELARLLGASLVLFHVEPQSRPWLIAPGVEYAYLPTTSSSQQGKNLLSHMEYLDKMAGQLSDKGISVSQEVASGFPAGEILSYAAANQIDLIALSTHGQSGIAEFVYGSVTEKVLYAGDTAVLVVRPPK
ncbi:MAG: universal stress protein [Dehalococcoidia bacterium]|nr:universal stress protein [Dehalococcoidia bacterium]